jgi:hypothetical protein
VLIRDAAPVRLPGYQSTDRLREGPQRALRSWHERNVLPMNTIALRAALAACVAFSLTTGLAHAELPLPPQTCIAGADTICSPNAHGDILQSPAVYLVFWGWNCSTGFVCNNQYNLNDNNSSIYALESMFLDVSSDNGLLLGHNGVGGTRWLNREAQYSGTLYGGNNTKAPFSNQYGLFQGEYFDDTDTYADLNAIQGENLTYGFEQLQQTVWNSAVHFGVQNNPNAIIYIARPPNAQAPQGYCAYHNALQVASNITFPVVYVDFDYNGLSSGGPCYTDCTSGSMCEVTAAAGHELIEAITDPQGQSANDQGYANWSDPSPAPETGDLCQTSNSVHTLAVQPSNNLWGPAYKNVALPQGVDDAVDGGACAYARATHSDVFVLGSLQTPAHVFRQTQDESQGSIGGDATWHDWGLLGGSKQLASAPTAASWAPGRVDVFAWDRSVPSQMVHGWVDSTNSACPGPDMPCTNSFGPLTSDRSWNPVWTDPVAVSWGPGRLDLFTVGCSAASFCNTFAVFHRTWDAGTDMGWTNIGPGPMTAGGLAYGVGATADGVGTIDVFFVGSDNQTIYHGQYTEAFPYALTTPNFSGWSVWLPPQVANGQSLTWSARPAAASWLYGRVDVMMVDSTGQIWDCPGTNNNSQQQLASVGSCTLWQSPSGITFPSIRGNAGSGPSVAALGDQRLLVSARGSDGQLWMQLFDNGQNTGGWVQGTGSLLQRSVTSSSW